MKELQDKIIRELNVTPEFDVREEIESRVRFLSYYLEKTGCESYVLGVSGGIDSTVAGILAREAVTDCRKNTGRDCRLIAVRLPYGSQVDEEDARSACFSILPHRILTVDIKPAVTETVRTLELNGILRDWNSRDFHIGNIKARQRMIVQYAIAADTNGLVIGTDHAAEAVMGFFTKFGDGAADLTPLAGLNKRRIRMIAEWFGVPRSLILKTPTADLESNKPQKPDEEAFGVTYDQIDDYLEGKEIDPEASQKIEEAFEKTRHKRTLPIGPDSERKSRLQKLKALDRIRRALQDGEARENLDFEEWLYYLDDVFTEEIRKL